MDRWERLGALNGWNGRNYGNYENGRSLGNGWNDGNVGDDGEGGALVGSHDSRPPITVIRAAKAAYLAETRVNVR